MAKVTNLTLRHKVIYQIYIRNFSKTGDFAGVQAALPRLKALGVDIICLMSIFPSSIESEGSGRLIYAETFTKINHAYGSFVDFMDLVDAIHDMGMQVVLNFSLTSLSIETPLLEEQPDYFQFEAGKPISQISLDPKVVDLEYKNPKMWDWLIGVLEYWAKFVDGVAVQNAQYIRPEFWASARAEVEDVHQYFYWLGSQVDIEKLYQAKSRRLPFWTEGELYSSFDVLNTEPMAGIQQRFLAGKISLDEYAYLEDVREMTTPMTSVMDRGLEIYPSDRFANRVQSNFELLHWTAMSFFQKGIASMMMGQEFGCTHPIPLHQKQVLAWERPYDMSEMIGKLARIKKREIMKVGLYRNKAVSELTLRISYHYFKEHLFGFFQLKEGQKADHVSLPLPDGVYIDLLSDSKVVVTNQKIMLPKEPVIIAYEGELTGERDLLGEIPEMSATKL